MTGTPPTTAAQLGQLLTRMPHPTAAEQVRLLEEALAATFGTRHAVAVASGTAALHIALRCLNIGPGDEVLVPALSVVMSAAPIVHAGARPVFVDCDPTGTDLDLDDVAAKTTPATKAILPVHLWGRVPDDPARLGATAAAWGLAVIEDACQAQGSTIGGRYAGTLGDVGCFSLKDGKILWAGEGGYLLTDDDEVAGRARALRSHHQPPYRTPPADVGYNYRLAEPLAVIARANLARFDELLARRRDQAQQLASLLTGTAGITVLAGQAGWNGYSFLAQVDLDQPRQFCRRLAQRGVPNSVGTFGLVPADRRPELARYAAAPCPNAAAVVDKTLAVVLTDHDDARITQYAQTIAQEARQWNPRP